jgi:hypothetical protein
LYQSGLSAGARSNQSLSRSIFHERSPHWPLASAPAPLISTVTATFSLIVMEAGIGSECPAIEYESSSIMKTLAGGSVEVNGGS